MPFRSRWTALAAVAVSAVLAAPAARANAILSYAGNDFTSLTTQSSPNPYSTADSIGFSITLAAAPAANLANAGIAMLGFSMTDGVDTVTNLNGFAPQLALWTDAQGQVTGWAFVAALVTPGSPGEEIILSSLNSVITSRTHQSDSVTQELCSSLMVSGDTTSCNLTAMNTAANSNYPGTLLLRTDVPEPSSAALLVGGAALLGLARRRRERGAARA